MISVHLTKSFFSLPREHKKTTLKLWKLLSDSSRTYRHRRNVINILITMLSWSVEFIGGLTIFLGSFIFGHGNHVITLTLQTLSIVFYFDILPCTFLINEEVWKVSLLDNRWYTQFITVFGSCLPNQVKPLEDENNDGAEVNNPQNKLVANDDQEEGTS